MPCVEAGRLRGCLAWRDDRRQGGAARSSAAQLCPSQEGRTERLPLVQVQRSSVQGSVCGRVLAPQVLRGQALEQPVSRPGLGWGLACGRGFVFVALGAPDLLTGEQSAVFRGRSARASCRGWHNGLQLWRAHT